MEITPVCANCKEIAQLLQISDNTVRIFAQRDKDPLPRFRLPGQKTWRYDVSEVLEWYERNRVCA